jgi:hypothetical protein
MEEKNKHNQDTIISIMTDIANLKDYIVRLKGLGIKVPEEVMVRGLEDIEKKYNLPK